MTCEEQEDWAPEAQAGVLCRCGHLLTDTDLYFCGYCGTQIRYSRGPRQAPAAVTSGRRAALAVLASDRDPAPAELTAPAEPVTDRLPAAASPAALVLTRRADPLPVEPESPVESESLGSASPPESEPPAEAEPLPGSDADEPPLDSDSAGTEAELDAAAAAVSAARAARTARAARFAAPRTRTNRPVRVARGARAATAASVTERDAAPVAPPAPVSAPAGPVDDAAATSTSAPNPASTPAPDPASTPNPVPAPPAIPAAPGVPSPSSEAGPGDDPGVRRAGPFGRRSWPAWLGVAVIVGAYAVRTALGLAFSFPGYVAWPSTVLVSVVALAKVARFSIGLVGTATAAVTLWSLVGHVLSTARSQSLGYDVGYGAISVPTVAAAAGSVPLAVVLCCLVDRRLRTSARDWTMRGRGPYAARAVAVVLALAAAVFPVARSVTAEPGFGVWPAARDQVLYPGYPAPGQIADTMGATSVARGRPVSVTCSYAPSDGTPRPSYRCVAVPAAGNDSTEVHDDIRSTAGPNGAFSCVDLTVGVSRRLC